MNELAKLDEGKLQTFKEKSRHMVPRCFGGFDDKDPLCLEYCVCARESDLGKKRRELEEKLNETPGAQVFSHHVITSCQDERVKIEAKLQKNLNHLKSSRARKEEMKKECLTSQSTRLRRIPQGKIRRERAFHDFTRMTGLYLEIQKNHLKDVVGIIYKLIPNGARPLDLKVPYGYIAETQPPLAAGSHYPVRVMEQKITERRNLLLTAQIQHYSIGRLDTTNTEGKRVFVEILGPPKETLIVDDIGEL